MLVLIALFATLGFAASAILLAAALRGYRVFVVCSLVTIYKVATGEVIALSFDDLDDMDDPENDE